MLARRLAAAWPLLSRQPLRPTPRQIPPLSQIRSLTQAEIDDPDMNGGYVNPPRVNRQHRDPYGDWWDKQERRNFGEPVHEDNDILGMFSPEEQTHITTGKAAFHLGCFVAAILALCGVVSIYYPDRPSAIRTFPGGLDKELGGPGSVPAPSDDEG